MQNNGNRSRSSTMTTFTKQHSTYCVIAYGMNYRVSLNTFTWAQRLQNISLLPSIADFLFNRSLFISDTEPADHTAVSHLHWKQGQGHLIHCDSKTMAKRSFLTLEKSMLKIMNWMVLVVRGHPLKLLRKWNFDYSMTSGHDWKLMTVTTWRSSLETSISKFHICMIRKSLLDHSVFLNRVGSSCLNCILSTKETKFI